MARPDRIITPGDVRHVIEHGRVIEDYPEDVRGHSCLLQMVSREGNSDELYPL
jgi:hypothetical protein